jgi:hypothetical protein
MSITAQQTKLEEYVALEAQVIARKAMVTTEGKRSELERLHRLVQLTIGSLKDSIKKDLSGEHAGSARHQAVRRQAGA